MENRNEILMKFISRQHQMREGGENDREMVEGIADILTQVKDPANRKAIAENMVADFKAEGVNYNLQDFLQRAQVEMAKGGQHGGLDRWFAEKWVDVKTGKECGRQKGEKRKGYPACRPSKRISEDTPKTASELSDSEKKRFKRTKTSSERIPYQHRRRDEGGEMISDMDHMKEGGNVPTNPELWSRAKAAAKAKYDVYPSAYANGYAAKWYKERGGGWKKAEMGGCMECGGAMEEGGEILEEQFYDEATDECVETYVTADGKRRRRRRKGSCSRSYRSGSRGPNWNAIGTGLLTGLVGAAGYLGFQHLQQQEDGGQMLEEPNTMGQNQQQSGIEAALNGMSQAIMEGEDPNSLVATLVEGGVPKEQAAQLVQEAMNRLQEDDEVEEEDIPMSTEEVDDMIEEYKGTEPDGNEYARGGSIKIDPSKKGTFKAQATRMGMSVQEAASYILKNKEEFSPAMVKKANFAKNFAKELGGEMMDLTQMKNGGGIPPRYRKLGFTRVGAKRKSTRPGKKWMVLAKKGDQYKVVHGGYKGMKDFTQHRNEKRRDRFWNRMGGKDSSKARDPFSPLYWHKRFGTWEEGGELSQYEPGGPFIEGDYVVTNTDKQMLSNLEDNKWNMGLAKANTLGDPRMMAWALPDKGLLGKVKAAAGIASGLSGAVLGYEKLFAKDKTTSNLYNEKTGEEGATADILDKRDQIARRKAMEAQVLAPSRLAPTSGSGLAGMEAEFKNKDVFGPGYLDYGYAFGGELPMADEGGDFREWFAKNAMRPDVMRISFDQAALMEMWKRETQQNTAAPAQTTTTNTPANTAGPMATAEGPAATTPAAPQGQLQTQQMFKFSERGDSAGIVAANNALAGLGMASGAIGMDDYEREYNRRLRQIGNSDERYQSYNPTNPFGNYTLNAGPASNFGLVANTPVQDFGTRMSGAKYGGQFAEGGEYYVSDKELKMILAMGGEIEYLD